MTGARIGISIGNNVRSLGVFCTTLVPISKHNRRLGIPILARALALFRKRARAGARIGISPTKNMNDGS